MLPWHRKRDFHTHRSPSYFQADWNRAEWSERGHLQESVPWCSCRSRHFCLSSHRRSRFAKKKEGKTEPFEVRPRNDWPKYGRARARWPIRIAASPKKTAPRIAPRYIIALVPLESAIRPHTCRFAFIDRDERGLNLTRRETTRNIAW